MDTAERRQWAAAVRNTGPCAAAGRCGDRGSAAALGRQELRGADGNAVDSLTSIHILLANEVIKTVSSRVLPPTSNACHFSFVPPRPGRSGVAEVDGAPSLSGVALRKR